MKMTLQACYIALFATLVAGCGKESPAPADAPAQAPDAAAQLNALVNAGVAAIAQKDSAAATDAAEKALALQPESAEACLMAGQAACLRQDFKQARSLFTSVITNKLPAVLRAKAYAGLGTVEFLQHNPDIARISFLQARRLDIKNDAAWYYLGLIYRDVYRFYEAADEHFKMFARLSRSDDPRANKVTFEILPELRKTLASIAASRPGSSSGKPGVAAALIREAEELVAKNNLPAAKKKYADAYAADPMSYAAALGYARILVKTDKSPEGVRKAILAYRAAIDQKPAVHKNYLEVAHLARENKLWVQAVEIMNRAVAHVPDKTEVLDQLISALIKTGNSKLANAWHEYRKNFGK